MQQNVRERAKKKSFLNLRLKVIEIANMKTIALKQGPASRFFSTLGRVVAENTGSVILTGYWRPSTLIYQLVATESVGGSEECQ